MHIDIADGDNIILTFSQRVRYVVVMTDDFTDYTIIYLLQRKFELKIILRKYLKQMKIRDTSVQRLRSNKKNEYADVKIQKIINDFGIN